MKTQKLSPGLLAVCVLSIYLVHGIPNGINPAIAELAALYPDASLSTITMISNIVLLACVPANLVCGGIISRIGFKPTALLGLGLALVGGLTPFFLDCPIGLLILLRAMVGVAYGLFLPMGGGCVAALYGEKDRPRMMGLGSSAAGISAMVLTLAGGWLATVSLRYVWLYHLVVLIPLFCVLIMPEPAMGMSGSPEGPKAAATAPGIGGATWFFVAAQGVAMLLLYPILVYMSNIVVGEGLGDAAVAGYVASSFSAATFVSGFVFGKVYGWFGKRILGVSALAMGLGFALVGVGRSLALLFLGNILAGFAYMSFNTYCAMSISVVTHPARITTAMGCGFACASVASTVSVYFYTFLGKALGKGDGDVRYMFFMSMAVFLAVGVWFLLRPKAVAKPEE